MAKLGDPYYLDKDDVLQIFEREGVRTMGNLAAYFARLQALAKVATATATTPRANKLRTRIDADKSDPCLFAVLASRLAEKLKSHSITTRLAAWRNRNHTTKGWCRKKSS